MTITTTELAEALNLPRATAHRWVKVAVEEGYLINHTERSRRPMQLEVLRGCSGDPTPAVLPSVEEVQKTYATRGAPQA